MKRKFYKMHGAGNDYIYFDCFEEPFGNPSAAAVRLSDRHFSIGGDGVVLILPSDKADAQMRMFNADGSEGKMCGNAIRCVAKYLRDVRGITKDPLTILTRSGIKTLTCVADRPQGVSVFTVDMGKPVFAPAKIPARFSQKLVVKSPLDVGGTQYEVTCLSMGNPHCVVFCGDIECLDLEKIGPAFENHPAFPARVNTEFVQLLGRDGRGQLNVAMRVWERGSGETWACGTGACATAVACVLNGYAETGEEIVVHLKGGVLKIVYTGKTVLMTGPAEFSFTGETEL